MATDLASGSQRSVLRDQHGIATSLAWSPRGDVIAYESAQVFDGAVSPSRLWLARADGQDVALMYGRGYETGSHPVWSLDGRRVAFYLDQERGIGIFDFTSRLQTVPSQVPANVSWSPDGDALVWVDRVADGGPRVTARVAWLRDGSARALIDGDGTDSLPNWSPAGDWIDLSRSTAEAGGLWLVRPDGSAAHPIHQAQGWTYSTPVWAPDGSAVAFSRHPTRVGASSDEAELWVAPIDSKPRQLSRGGTVFAWVP
jgi:Tol biopolymer transport system component